MPNKLIFFYEKKESSISEFCYNHNNIYSKISIAKIYRTLINQIT